MTIRIDFYEALCLLRVLDKLVDEALACGEAFYDVTITLENVPDGDETEYKATITKRF